MKVHLVQMGGTVDKDYVGTDEHHGYNFSIDIPGFIHILHRQKEMGMKVLWDWVSIAKKDSQDNTKDDRRRLRHYIDLSEEKRIIVTHGTDTILETAKAIGDLTGKTIILTGAMKPEKYRVTDAEFTLGLAFAAVQILPPGVYIALCGEVKPWHEFHSELTTV